MNLKKIICVLLPLLLFLSGCQKDNNLSKNLSRIRDNCFYGESQNYQLTAYPEVRETPMIADGIINPPQKTVILKLKVKDNVAGEYTVSFTTDKQYSDTFNFSALSDSYVISIDVDMLPNKPFIATITRENDTQEINLESKLSKDTISSQKALDCAYKHKKEYIESKSINGVFGGEIYLRLIADGSKNYWYVGIITKEETLCLLLDGSGNLLEEKTIPNPL